MQLGRLMGVLEHFLSTLDPFWLDLKRILWSFWEVLASKMSSWARKYSRIFIANETFMYESLYGIYWLPLECFLEVFGVIILVFWGPSSASPAHTQASSLRVASAGCAKREQFLRIDKVLFFLVLVAFVRDR